MIFDNQNSTENDFFTAILSKFGEEIRQFYVELHEEDSSFSNEIKNIVFLISEIIIYSTTDDYQKMLGSLSHDITGHKAVQRMNTNRTNIDHMFHELSQFDEIGYYYSLFKIHEFDFQNTSYVINENLLIKNIEHYSREDLDLIFNGKDKSYIRKFLKKMTAFEKSNIFNKYIVHSEKEFLNNFIDDSLTIQLNELNEKVHNIKELLRQYNQHMYDLKRELVSLKSKKSFIFLVYKIYQFLPNSTARTGKQKKFRYIYLINKCFSFIEKDQDLSIFLNKGKKRFVIDNLPTKFSKCIYISNCKNNCTCPLVNDFKKCMNPPKCKKCGYVQSIHEKYHHVDAPFAGYEFSEEIDFCLSMVGIKPESRKKRKK